MTKIKSGYIQKPHLPAHKVFKSTNSLGGIAPNPSGDWSAYLPPQTEQQNIGVEPECCTSEGTLNAQMILADFLFKDSTVWSARFLAYISATTQSGNDPITVIDALRKKGVVPESDWPNTSALTTWADFYSPPPQNLYTKALEFIAEYVVGYEWVSTNPASMMEALTYSPLGVSGFAWEQDPTTGYYITPQGETPCHFFVVFGYQQGQYWLCFDSYEQNIKKLAWNYQFGEAMRYSLTNQIVNPSAWAQFLALLKSIIGL